MKQDPALCLHNEIGKSAKVETITIPELGIQQLVLKVKVFCRACKESFIFKTYADGFSTSEIGLVGDELFIPLEQPQVELFDGTDIEPLTQAPSQDLSRSLKEKLH